MKLPPQLEKLSQIKYAKQIGLVLTVLLDIVMLLVAITLNPQLGYYIMIVSLVIITFAVPYLFGWRNGKKLAILGIGVFLLVGAINGPLVVHSAYSAEPPAPSSSDVHVTWFTGEYDFDAVENGTYTAPDGVLYSLENGTVSPYKDSTGQTYRFSVTIYTNDTSAPDVRFGYARGLWGFVDSMYMTEVDPTDTDFEDGKEYYRNVTIDDPGIYSYWFGLVLESGADASSLNTSVNLGPLVGSQSENWGAYIPIGALSMFCNIGLLFIIIVLLYWWLGTAKEKRKTWDKALREKEDGPDSGPKPFSCDQCGAPVGVDDNFCPKCGERFDEVEGEPDAGKELPDEKEASE